MTTEKTNKNEKKYICDLCDYISFKKTDYNRHLLTSKHLKLQNTTFSSEKNENLEYKRFLCECGKKYKHHSSLWSHKKKCNFL